LYLERQDLPLPKGNYCPDYSKGMAMNISLALGFHFDSSKNNSPAQPLGHGHRLQPLPAAGPVIDVLPEPDTSSQTTHGSNYKLFLTYDFRGLPEPAWADISILNIYA
jgi:hypothetical protein